MPLHDPFRMSRLKEKSLTVHGKMERPGAGRRTREDCGLPHANPYLL